MYIKNKPKIIDDIHTYWCEVINSVDILSDPHWACGHFRLNSMPVLNGGDIEISSHLKYT